MRAIYTLIFVLMAGTAYGQSNLPACQESDVSSWSNCSGAVTFADGNKYVGEFKDGKYNGKGTYTFARGDKYVGEWKDGKYNGQATFTHADGAKYVGEFKDAKRHGQGTYTHPNGNKYVGDYEYNKGTGRGIFYNANGSIKESGIYKDNVLITSQYIDPNSFTRIAKNNSAPAVSDSQRQAIDTAVVQSSLPACQGSDSNNWSNCFGTETYSNGDKYVGEWKGGKSSGQGTYIFIGDNQFKGDKYVGEYKDDKFNGQGTYTHATGNKYVGEFRDGKRNGQGTYTWASGNKHVGEFKDNTPNGQGINYSANGNILESGIYKDNVLVTSQYIDPNSFTRIARNSTAPEVSDSQRQAIEQREIQVAIEAVQSKLPACQGSDESRWTNCFGSWAYSSGIKYLGEYKNGKPNGQGTFRWPKGQKHVGEIKDGIRIGQGTLTFPNGDKYVGEWKDGSYNGRGIFYKADGSIKESGIYKDDKLITSQYIDPNSFTRIARNNSAPAVSDSQRQAIEQRERQVAIEAERVAEERRKLDEDKRQRELAKQSSRITISATATQPDSSGVVTINIQTNTDTSSLKINGEELGGKADGSYSVKRVARVGQETKFTIAGVDVNGNTDTKTVTVVRQTVDSKAVFGQLNAANVKQQPARDAVAIIIGIEKYKRVAKADFANADAQDFYDYASRALGIKQENIKLLVDDGADDVEILQAFQNWLPLKVKKGKTDVYVFFSGHGYPSEDGKGLYFLPYGVDKNYMDRTAVKQKEVTAALQSVQPKSVTMFIDSCYSGQTRGGETLVAGSKPIALKQSETAYPPEFTVITASTMDQISWSSPDLKHGLFSYYLMKGMEGDSDLNKDGKVTVAEMQEYLTDMVGRHAMGMNRNQQPQLFGDPNKVLISR